ncbi:UDP-forming cellulose synthase catalytic subunit [Edwardsiella tarda]|uniref:UDP-forming cellulose synthase catalytic subunit n=1 Tax=Edwardsiella tarda TaxID=636 RepID=UPI00266F9616|nr:UDP-forming cellulose synthase catalytic subunit [Edwardsiella tarda]WKS81347.1 UDP-forming cellulose synthase catalytic subunit [Edwardsiella tarda]
MMHVLDVLLAADARRAWIHRYRAYREHGASSFSAGVGCCWVALAWAILCLESPAWQAVRQQRARWFPHIDPLRPRLLDPLRYLLQGLWLVSIGRPASMTLLGWVRCGYRHMLQWLAALPSRLAPHSEDDVSLLSALPSGLRRIILAVVILLASALALLCISQPFDLVSQAIFVLLLWGCAMVIRHIPGRFTTLLLVLLSITVSCRYIWWRYTTTLNWDDPFSLICGLLLLAAESYAWVVLVLGYFQSIWPLNRPPVALPKDVTQWPTVDILVPTYNEDLRVVKPTIYAALGIDWPRDRINIYLLDDGNRESFRDFAQEVGIHYIARPTHEHAKAGNLNYALKRITGEFVAVFDCDHVPTRTFLQLTMGWFLREKRLAILQTPHHFFSPDPFERNLGNFRRTPNEGQLFYGLLQNGNDMWNAAFFCGSCTVLRRCALDEIGGIAVETVTEDAHTSLRLHRQGWSSAYIRIPLAAGLATESLSAHIGQRMRWARGMTQIFRLDNPFLGRGLSMGQRLCYANAMLHFLSGIPRLIFLLAPLAFLLFHTYVIFAPALAIILYVLPHMYHSSLARVRLQGRYRHSYWNEIYETVLAWYIARPTLVALINPRKGRFNVTQKGGLVAQNHMDWVISSPYLILVLLNVLGLLFGAWRLLFGPENELFTVLLTVAWVMYNLIILGGAAAVAVEVRQLRQAHRVEMAMPAVLMRHDGHLYPCTLRDYSDGGVGVELADDRLVLQEGEPISLLLQKGTESFVFPITVTRVFGRRAGLRLEGLSVAQHIAFVQCTFARADTWALWQQAIPEDHLGGGFVTILRLVGRGYRNLAEYAPAPWSTPIVAVVRLSAWLLSFLPRPVARQPNA